MLDVLNKTPRAFLMCIAHSAVPGPGLARPDSLAVISLSRRADMVSPVSSEPGSGPANSEPIVQD